MAKYDIKTKWDHGEISEATVDADSAEELSRIINELITSLVLGASTSIEIKKSEAHEEPQTLRSLGM